MVAQLYAEYDMQYHASCQAQHAKNLPDDFLDRFAILGHPDEIVERIHAITSVSIDRLVLVTASPGAAAGLADKNVARISTEVLPRLRNG